MKHIFELKSKDPNKESSILYKCYLKAKRFSFGIEYKIYPALWDFTNQKPIRSKAIIKEYKSEIPNIAIRLNNLEIRMNNVRREVETFISNAELQGTEIDLEALKQHLKSKVLQSTRSVGKSVKQNENGKNGQFSTELKFISKYIEKFIHDISHYKRLISTGTNNNKKYGWSTIKNYIGFQVQWLEFEASQKKKFSWDDLGMPFYNEFLAFYNDKGYKWDTTGRMVKHLKVIAQAAMEEGIHKNGSFRDQKFKTLSSKIENIALTFAELEKLENLDLSSRPAWEKARDLFLIGCYTALRFSDIKRLNKNHFFRETIEIVNLKTKFKVIIPCKTNLRNLLIKYDYRLPILPEQKVNEYIKQIAESVGINEPIERTEIIGGVSKIINFKKYELITTHTGRRTAATHMYMMKMLPKDIMAITGHSTESSFMKYICLPKEERVQRMAANDFFK